MKNAKKQIGVWFLTALLLAVMSFSAFAVDSFTVSAEANKTSANVGDIITVNVVLSKGTPVSVATVVLKYDPACFEYQNDAKFAALCKGDGVSGNINDSVSGQITFAAITEGSFKEGGTMLTASFKVLKVNSDISLELKTIGQDDFDATNITEYGTAKGIKIACAHGSTKENITKAPTHTEAGQKATVCTACGASLKTESVPAQGHTFGAWKVTTPATCLKEGVETRTCSCGVSETRSIPKTAHAPGEWKVTKEPTCTEKGVRTSTCSVCNAEFTEEIAALGHSADKWETVKAATCTEKGVKKATCAVCGEEFTEEIAALGHNFGEWKVTKEATKNAEGSKERVCSVCGEKETAVIAKLADTPTQDGKNPDIPKTSGATAVTGITVAMLCGASALAVITFKKKERV